MTNTCQQSIQISSCLSFMCCELLIINQFWWFPYSMLFYQRLFRLFTYWNEAGYPYTISFELYWGEKKSIKCSNWHFNEFHTKNGCPVGGFQGFGYPNDMQTPCWLRLCTTDTPNQSVERASWGKTNRAIQRCCLQQAFSIAKPNEVSLTPEKGCQRTIPLKTAGCPRDQFSSPLARPSTTTWPPPPPPPA